MLRGLLLGRAFSCEHKMGGRLSELSNCFASSLILLHFETTNLLESRSINSKN